MNDAFSGNPAMGGCGWGVQAEGRQLLLRDTPGYVMPAEMLFARSQYNMQEVDAKSKHELKKSMMYVEFMESIQKESLCLDEELKALRINSPAAFEPDEYKYLTGLDKEAV